MDDFKSWDVALRENPEAFTYDTEVQVKNVNDGSITSGKFTYGTFGPSTFEIEDENKNKKTFNKNDVFIKIIKANTDTNYHYRGGKKTYRKKISKSSRRKSARRKSARRKSARRKSARRR
jgi:hypothetical protein